VERVGALARRRGEAVHDPRTVAPPGVMPA